MNMWKSFPMWLMVVGMGAMGFAVGCEQAGNSASPPSPTAETSAESAPVGEHHHAEHDHGDHGPHGGELVELGQGDYHAEVVHDDKSDTITVYLLDRAAKHAVSTDAETLRINVTGDGEPQQYELAAVSGEEGDGSSEFTLADEGLAAALHAEKAKARLTVSIDGKNYSGNVPTGEEHDHEHGHDRDHDHG